MKSNQLVKLFADKKVIGTVGICKNAGKTTVLNYLVEGFRKETSYKLGITSIGYDGEDVDTVTNLEKPRISVGPGIIVATADECLLKTDVEYRLLYTTKIKTPIGGVQVVEVLSEGMIEVAGPSIVSQMGEVIEVFKTFRCNRIIVDGAAGRFSHGLICDGNILAVGAACGGNLDKVIEKAKYKLELFSLPEVEMEEPILDKPYEYVKAINSWVFRGIFCDEDAKEVLSKEDYDKHVIVKDPASIFLSPMIYKMFIGKGGRINVRSSMSIDCVTINPMNPYGEWFDKDEFLEKMKAVCKQRVLNIENEKVNENDE